ncbi:unnamed protein product [Ectocarpus sp. 6 AP-2014]
MRGITKAEVRQHNTQHDCWSIFRGKVYNLTPFLHYHPGGIPEIMKGAGRDCTALFDKYHRWVNFDSLVGNLYLGPLVTEKELEASSGDGGDKPAAEATGEGKAKDEATAAGKEGGDGDVDGVAGGDVGKVAVALEQMSTAGRQELDRAESTGPAV